MKRFHAMIWLGVALIAAGGYRLVAPFSATVGTVRTSCGNAVAYLDGQDKQAAFTSTLSVCEQSLRRASLEGAAGAVVGLLLFIIGIVLYVRARRRRRALRPTPAQAQAQAGPVGSGVGANREISNAEVYEQFMRLGRLTRPKTVLSFFAILFAALIAGSVVAISLFLKNPDLTRYIVWILVFDAIVAIMLIVGVFVTITKDPAKLMLSEIANQNSVALTRGRRRSDVAPVSAVRVAREPTQEEQQFRRRREDQGE